VPGGSGKAVEMLLGPKARAQGVALYRRADNGEIFIARHDLKAKDEVLVQLTRNTSATGGFLHSKAGDSNGSRFQRNLREMVSDKLISVAANGEYFIMPHGQALVAKKSLLRYEP
jgi:hypothetical protein